MPHPPDAVATIDAYLSALARRDLDAILALYAEDATVEDPVGSEPIQGHAALRAFYARALAMTLQPERQGTVKVSGPEAAFHFTLTMPELARRIDIIEVMRFDDAGKVASMRAFWSRANVERL